MNSMCWYTTSALLAVFSFLFMVAAAATHLWVWLTTDGEYIGVGLFDRIGLSVGGVQNLPAGFTGVKFLSEDTLDSRHWKAMAGLIIAACVLSGIFLVLYPFYFVFTRKHRATRSLYKAMMFFSILSLMCDAAGLVVFVIYHGDALTTSLDISDISFSWSFAMSLLGIVLGILAALILALKLENEPMKAIPAAADHNMNLYPATKTGMDNLVFQGPAYSTGTPAMMDIDGASFHSQPLSVPQPQMNGGLLRPESPRKMTGIDYYNSGQFQSGARDMVQRQSFSEAQRVNSPTNEEIFYRGPARESYTSMNGHAGRGGEELQKKVLKTTLLDRRDQDVVGNTLQEERIFDRLPPRPPKPVSQDFLVTAKHSTEKDVYRQDSTYLRHVLKKDESAAAGQRLVLSPENFSSNNVKYNPNFVYRPYSEQVY